MAIRGFSKLTLKQRYRVLELRNEAITAYLDFCSTLSEVPRPEIYEAFNSLSDDAVLKDLIKKLQIRKQEFLSKKEKP